MDKYGADQDGYCYPDSDVLMNRLNIEDGDALSDAEREITALAAEDIEFEPPPYDLSTLQDIHRRLFEDIDDWAGDIRTVDVSKGDTRFCTAQRIVPEAGKLFAQLADKKWLEANILSALGCDSSGLAAIFEKCVGEKIEG